MEIFGSAEVAWTSNNFGKVEISLPSPMGLSVNDVDSSAGRIRIGANVDSTSDVCLRFKTVFDFASSLTPILVGFAEVCVSTFLSVTLFITTNSGKVVTVSKS